VVTAVFNRGLADRLNVSSKSVPVAEQVTTADAWARAADVDLERECRHAFDFFCLKPLKPLEGDPIGEQLTLGCIAFLSVATSGVYLTTGNAAVQVAAVMVTASGSKAAYLTSWGDLLARHLDTVASDFGPAPIWNVTDPVPALRRLAADYLNIVFPEAK
jgi:hypothetical protein